MKFKTKMMSMFLAGLMAFTFVGCGSTTENTGTGTATATTTESATGGTEAVAPAVASGEYLNVMFETEVVTLDPQLATDGVSFELIANITDGLLQMGRSGEPIPAIAKTVEVSEDGLTYTFTLREDAYWSNGSQVTADDFVFGWQRAVDPANASEYSYMLSDIAQVVNAQEIVVSEKGVEELGVEAVDDFTFVVNLNVPVSYFESLMYFPTFYPINRAFFEEVGMDAFATSPATSISNGAFVLEEYEPAALALAVGKNQDYYDADKIALSGINYQVVKDSQQAFMSYQGDGLDLITLTGDQVDQVEGDPELAFNGAGYMWYLTMNVNDITEIDNKNLRLAIMNGIDREELVTDVLKDGSVATYTAVPPAYSVGPNGEDFSADQMEYAEICSYNPELAKEYFELAKAELGQETFTFELLVEDSTESQNVGVVIKEQLESVLEGTTFDLVIKPKKQRLEDIQSGNYEICLTRWGPDYADPMTYLGMWVTGISNNYGLWSNAEYDQLILDCTSGEYVGDPELRWEMMKKAESIVMEDAAIVPIYTKSSAVMLQSYASGVDFHAVGINRVYKYAVKE